MMLTTSIAMVFIGSVSTVCGKILEQPDESGVDFKHPMVLTLFMFAGESLMYFVFTVKRWTDLDT